VFEPSICLIVNNEYDLRKFLAECDDDIDNYTPNSMFNLKMPNYSQTLSQENLHYSNVSKASKSKRSLSALKEYEDNVNVSKKLSKLPSVKSTANLDVIDEIHEINNNEVAPNYENADIYFEQDDD
jgi:hypothetical protein